jgi:hypothetical protein
LTLICALKINRHNCCFQNLMVGHKLERMTLIKMRMNEWMLDWLTVVEWMKMPIKIAEIVT